MSDSDDDFVEYGIPLESLEEENVTKKRPYLAEDQTVKDKHGKRRFHGAFTGGFSAGFFNSVGSLEGWKPSSFKSSKTAKKEISIQKPEDFMDEEDLDVFGIAPVILKAKKDYLTDKKKYPHFSDASFSGAFVLKQILKPVRETVGMKLLKKMGWKPGQGVGPRSSKREKTNNFKIRHKIYGCQLPSTYAEQEAYNSDSDLEWEDITLAPDDYEPYLSKTVKDNFFGIGYKGLDKRPILGSHIKRSFELTTKCNETLEIRGQAFGVGAFEEEDEDVYSRDDLSHYDFSIGNDNNRVEESVKNSIEFTGVLDGFIAETKKFVQKLYPLPELPASFNPQHVFRNSRWDNSKSGSSASKDHFSAKERLSFLKDNIDVSRVQELKRTEELIMNVKINYIEFKPFSLIPDKQERYEKYLKLIQIGREDRFNILQPVTMTDGDKLREKVEFEQAANLFKPLTGVMEARFLTASQPDSLSDPMEPVEKLYDDNDERKKAAKMNMFGSLTRKVEEWIPNSMVCKRFNIPDTNKRDIQQAINKTQKYSIFDGAFDSLAEKETIKSNIVEKSIKNVTEISIEKNELQKHHDNNSVSEDFNKQESIVTRSKVDIFKEIFLVSDEEDEDGGEKIVKNEEKRRKSEKEKDGKEELNYEEKVVNDKRNTSSATGIFENIDLESLSRREICRIPKNDELLKLGKDLVDVPSSSLMYGPKVPDKVVICKNNFNTIEEKDGGHWVEKKLSNRKHKKKDKKSKKSVHKSKRRHKKLKK